MVSGCDLSCNGERVRKQNRSPVVEKGRKKLVDIASVRVYY